MLAEKDGRRWLMHGGRAHDDGVSDARRVDVGTGERFEEAATGERWGVYTRCTMRTARVESFAGRSHVKSLRSTTQRPATRGHVSL